MIKLTVINWLSKYFTSLYQMDGSDIVYLILKHSLFKDWSMFKKYIQLWESQHMQLKKNRLRYKVDKKLDNKTSVQLRRESIWNSWKFLQKIDRHIRGAIDMYMYMRALLVELWGPGFKFWSCMSMAVLFPFLDILHRHKSVKFSWNA